MNTYHSIGSQRVTAPDHQAAAQALADRHASNRWPCVAGTGAINLTLLHALPDDAHAYRCKLRCPLDGGGAATLDHYFIIYKV